MLNYFIRRVMLSIISIFIVVTIVFFVMHSIPSNPFVSQKTINAKIIEAKEEKYGLNKSIFKQYITYLKQVLKCDYGESIFYSNQLVVNLIMNGIATSFCIGFIAATISIFLGILLGVVSATTKGRLLDKIIILSTTILISLPSFIIGVTLLWMFGVKLKMLPTRGDTIAGLIMPIITLFIYPTAYITRLIRTTMIEVLSQDYIRTAKAKGASNRRILFKHALKNAITPVITYAGPMIAYLITGSFVVEKIFSISGIGSYFITSIQNSDYPMIMGTTIFLAIIIAILNLMCDFLYKILDKRIQFDRR